MTETLGDNEEHVGTDFDRLQLSGRVVSDGYFEDCTFTDCDLSEGVLDRAEMVGCRFDGCNLSLIAIPETRFAETTFEACKLTGIDWTTARWPSLAVTGQVEFHRCTLDLSVFSGLALPEVTFDQCSLVEVDFTDCDLSDASFVFSNMDRARFSGCDLHRAHLEGATDYAIDLGNNRLRDATVSMPEAQSFLSQLGLTIVEPPPQP